MREGQLLIRLFGPLEIEAGLWVPKNSVGRFVCLSGELRF